MPSAVNVVDLTGSDDESPRNIARRNVSGIRDPSGPKKSPQANLSKASSTQGSFSALSQNDNGHLNPGGSSSSGSASRKVHVSNGKTRPRTTPLHRDPQDGLERDDTPSRPRTPARRDDASNRPTTKPIVLSDDVLPQKPVFRRPRTFDGDSSQRSSQHLDNGSARDSGTPPAQPVQSQKRQRDQDDVHSERAFSKKNRFDRSNENDAVARTHSMLDEAQKRSIDRHPAQRSKKQGGVIGTIDLTASPPRSPTITIPSSAEEGEQRSALRPTNTSSRNGKGVSEGVDGTSVDVKPPRATSSKSPLEDLSRNSTGLEVSSRKSSNGHKQHSSSQLEPQAGLFTTAGSSSIMAESLQHIIPEVDQSEEGDMSIPRQWKRTAKAMANGASSHLSATANTSKKGTLLMSQPHMSQSRWTTLAQGLEHPEFHHSASEPGSDEDQRNKRRERTNNSRCINDGTEAKGVAMPNHLAVTDSRSSSRKESSLHQNNTDKWVPGVPTPKAIRRSSSPSSAAAADLQLRTEAMAHNVEDDPPPCNTATDMFIMPTLAASAASSSMWAQMPLPNRIEKVLGKYLEEMKEDNEYWAATLMEQARTTSDVRPPEEPSSKVSFAGMRPIRFSAWQKRGSMADNEQQWKVEQIGPNGKGLGVTAMTAQYRTFKTEARDVPSYAHYVGIQNNFLAPNVKLLHCWPYFGDDFDVASADNLNEQYQLDIANREEKLLLLQQAQKYESYVGSVLRDLDCTWADVLRYLIKEQPRRQATSGKSLAREDEQRRNLHNFSPNSSRSIAILKNLPQSTPEKMDRIEILNERFEKMAKFSLWHVARRSAEAKISTKDADNVADIDAELICRLCLRFNCPYHGELNERGDDDSEGDSSIDNLLTTDIVDPPKLDQRDHVSLPIPSSPPVPVDFRTKSHKKDAMFWRSSQLYTAPDERVPFHPCHHPGLSCDTAQCACVEEDRPCEKSCGCASSCSRRFQGCSCAKRGQRCFNDLDCACFNASRECDPDLCGRCGVCEIVDPVNRYNEGPLRGRCQNCYIQRGIPMQTLLGDSGIHGLGLYACEDVREHDFVGEYKGEIITKEEAERRGAVYEIQKLSYLFSLNATQEIDSTYFGNKVRFINHASRQKANLYPRIMMVNTVHRIALYASKNIKAGQELLFDYGPKFPDEQLGGKKQKKSAPHVRNANLVKSFVDVEESEDEVGNVRAKAVNRSAIGRGRPSKSKKRGRPRARGEAEEVPVQGRTDASALNSFQQAGERLAAFNISDDPLDDPMELDNEAEDEGYRDGEESEYDSEESEERQDSEDTDSGED